jgi:hypothetical protein
MWVEALQGKRRHRVWIAAPAGAVSAATVQVREHERALVMYAVDLGVRTMASNLSSSGCYAGLTYRRARRLDELTARRGLLYVSAPYDTPLDPFEDVVNAKVQTAKATTQHYVSRGLTPAIGQRLTTLIDAAREEYPETDIPNQSVLESALQFLRSRKDLQTPLFALTSVGGLWLEWRGAEGRAAALEFKRDGSVNLAAFYPDPEQPLQMSSRAISMSWQSASREIKSNKGLSWLFAA